MAVGATDINDQRASFSSTGSTVEVTAPGANILSANNTGGYKTLSGTSMASPHVAGLAALIMSSGAATDLNGDFVIDQDDVRQLIRNTARDLGTPGVDPQYGHGLVNAEGSVIPAPANNPPTADAGGPYAADQGQSIPFDGSGSQDPDQDSLNYAWDFGDGGTGTGVSPSHTYTTSGGFTVTLVVSDSRGGVDDDTATATITRVNQAPVAEAGQSQSVALGDPVTLDGSGSQDPDGSITSWDWDFGDSTAGGSGETVQHTYASAGTFTVTLAVTEDQNLSDQATTTVSVVDSSTQVVHVEGVDVALRSRFRGWKTWAEATVLVQSGTGAPVSAAVVTVQWSGATSQTATVTTNSSGVAFFQSSTVRRPSRGTVF